MIDFAQIENMLDESEDVLEKFRVQINTVFESNPEFGVENAEDLSNDLHMKLGTILDHAQDYSNNHEMSFMSSVDLSDLTPVEAGAVKDFFKNTAKDVKNAVLDPLTDKEYRHNYTETRMDIANELATILQGKILKRFKNIQVKDKEPAIQFIWRGKAYKAVITED